MKKHETVTDFSSLALRLSGMRGSREYRILCRDEETEITLCRAQYASGAEKWVPEKQVLCQTAEMIRILNDCRFLSWDGFHGKHPRGVLDGTQFFLKGTVNGDQTVTADGSQNFPRGFRDLTDALHQILSRETSGPN